MSVGLMDMNRNISDDWTPTSLREVAPILSDMGAGQGGRIAVRRKELGLSKAALGKLVGVSRVTILNWESADAMDIKDSKLKKLARALRVSESYIVDNGPMAVSEGRGPLDVELLTDCLVGLDIALDGRKEPPERRAEIILALYEFFISAEAKPTRNQVVQFVRRIA
jgi:transcriptional regulator with XRE-family HTH domain